MLSQAGQHNITTSLFRYILFLGETVQITELYERCR